MSQRSRGKLNPGLRPPAIATVLVICLATVGQSQEKFGYLHEWIGKYPTYNDNKPHREFLMVRAIRVRLQRLLSARDFQFVTKTCGKETPIEERELLAFAIQRLALGMDVCQRLETEQRRRPWSEQVLPYGLANMLLITPSAWTLTESSREVRLPAHT